MSDIERERVFAFRKAERKKERIAVASLSSEEGDALDKGKSERAGKR